VQWREKVDAEVVKERLEVASRFAGAAMAPPQINLADPTLDPLAASRLLAARRESDRILREAKRRQLQSARSSLVRFCPASQRE